MSNKILNFELIEELPEDYGTYLFLREDGSIKEGYFGSFPYPYHENDGELIDPTWIGERFKGSAYFGVVFTDDFAREIAQKTKCYGILDNDYMNEHQLKREGFPPHALHPVFHSSVSVPE